VTKVGISTTTVDSQYWRRNAFPSLIFYYFLTSNDPQLLSSSSSSSSSFSPIHPLQHENGEGSSALKSSALLLYYSLLNLRVWCERSFLLQLKTGPFSFSQN
jgi:hypothetical protein